MAEQVQVPQLDLERRVSEMTRDLATLYAITSPISAAHELKGVLADALAMIMQVAGADAGTIRLIDPQTNRFMVSSYVGLSEIYVREAPLATGDGEMFAEALRSGQPAIAGDLLQDPRTRQSPLLRDSLRSAVYLPLKTPENDLGVVVLASREPGGFSPNQGELFGVVARQVSATIENARLHEETDRRRREAEELARVAQSLTESLDVEAVAKQIVEGVRRLLDVRDATVYQLQDAQSLLALAVSDDSGLRKAGVVLPVGTGVAGQAVVRGEAVFSTDILHDPKIVLAELHERLAPVGDRSVLAVPLRSKGQIIGALSVSGQVGHLFAEADIALLQTFGDQAALALENAHLYEQTERRRREAEELARVAQFLTESLDMTAVGERIVTSILELFGVKAAMLRLLQPDGSLRTLASSGESLSQSSGGDILPPGAGLTGLAIAQGKPVWSADVLSEPEIPLTDQMRDHQLRSGNRSMIAVPLRAHEKIIGSLGLSDQTGRTYSDGEVALLQTFADQAALALENARLFEETERRRREAEELARVARSLTESLDMTAVGERIVASVQELFGVKAATLRLLQPDGSLGSLALSGEPLSGGLVLPPGAGLTGLAVAEGRPIWCADVSNMPGIRLTDQMCDHHLHSGNRSLIAVPLRAHEKVIGSLALSDQTGRTYSDSEVALLQTFADQAALALENARLFEETERRAQEISTLHEIGTKLVSTLDLSAVLEEIAGSAIQLIGAQRCAVFELDPRDQRLHMRASRGMRPDQPFMPMKLGQGAAGSAALQRHPVFSADVHAQPLPMYDEPWEEAGTTLREVVRRRGYRAILAVPLVSKETGLGAICIYWDEIHAYDEREVQLLTALAQQAAVAIENARLYEETEHRAREQAAVNAIATAVSQSLHLDELLQTALDKVLEVTGRECGYIRLKDSVTGEITLASHRGISEGHRKALVHGRTPGGKSDQVFESGEPVVVNDLEHALLKAETRGEGFHSMVWIPLKARGNVVGILNVAAVQPIPFTPEDMELLQSIGNVIGVAVENARLYEEAERQRREAEELAQVARSLTESLELEAVATRIVDGVRRLLKVPESTVFRLQTDGSLVAVALSGALKDDGRKAGYVLSPGVGVSGQAVACGEPVYCADILRDVEIAKAEIHQHLAASGIRAVVSTPIRSKGQIIGALAAGDQAGRVYAAADIALLQTFGDQAALALENARLYEAERTRQEELNAVRKVGQEVSTELELEPLLHLIVRRAVELAGVSSGIVYTLEDEMLVPRAWWNLGSWLAEVRFRLGQGIPGIVAQRGEAMIINDYLHSPYVNPLFKEHSTVTALIAMPLISKGKVVGVITINHSETNRRFTEADQAILSLFAPQAATAIENARLFEETEQRRREAEELGRVSRTLTESLDVSAVGQRIVESVLPLFAAHDAVVWLVQPDSSMVVLASTAPTQDPLARGYVFPPGVGLPTRAITEGRPVWFSDILSRDDILLPDDVRRHLTESGTAAVLAVPLHAKGKTIGALVVRDRTGRVFSKNEVALLEMFAAQGGLALENARLFEETRRLVGELGATTKELGAKNKELDTFVYTVSHDLKAPLVTLHGMADLLAESSEKDLDEQGRHYVTRIKANAQQMERLVQDLLALSRIGREGRPPEAVPLDEVTDEILMEWGERIRARGVTVTRHELPTLWGVRTQIEQVVSNLLGNAIKYLGDTPAPVVEIGAKDGGGELVECYVKDNGIGIDPAYHEKVFEIFQRLKETEAEGTGVGLAIVKKIVEGAGGRIWVESAKGRGAAFRFTWPKDEGMHGESHG